MKVLQEGGQRNWTHKVPRI